MGQPQERATEAEHVTPAGVVGAWHPRFLLDANQGMSRSSLINARVGPAWQQLFDRDLHFLLTLAAVGLPASL